MSYAGLVHAEDTSDPARSKFYGDVAEKITAASAHVLFFALELNRIPDAALDRALKTPALAHYRPWIEDVRKEKPYQLEDRVELLFHEKSVTAAGAWNRLFDETIAALRFRSTARSCRSSRRSTSSRTRTRRSGRRRRGACRDLREEHPPVHPDHQHARQGQGNLRPLARLQGRRRARGTCRTASSRRWWTRWWRRSAPPIRGSPTATTS